MASGSPVSIVIDRLIWHQNDPETAVHAALRVVQLRTLVHHANSSNDAALRL